MHGSYMSYISKKGSRIPLIFLKGQAMNTIQWGDEGYIKVDHQDPIASIFVFFW